LKTEKNPKGAGRPNTGIKRVIISISCQPEQANKLKELAAAEKKTVSNYILEKTGVIKMKSLYELVDLIYDDVSFHNSNCKINYDGNIKELVSNRVSSYFDESLDFKTNEYWFEKAYKKIYNEICDFFDSL